MEKTFEDALGELLLEYAETDVDEKISAMEIQIMVLVEEND